MLNIITQNVMCTPQMRQSFVVDDMELTAAQADIILWQEIQIQRYVDAVSGLNDEGFASYNGMDKGGAPISWRKDRFEFVDGGQSTMYFTTPGISRTRKVVWVKLRHLRTHQVIVVVNAHFVTGKGTSFIRTRLWNRCRKVLIKTVSRFVNNGYAVIVGGDFNSRDHQIIGRFFEKEDGTRRGVRYPVPLDEIDQIILINGDDLVFGDTRYKKEGGRNSDHQGNKVTTSLRKKK